MINGISSSSQAAPAYQAQQHQQGTQVPKNAQQDEQPQDTVVLSKQATGANDTAKGDADHDGH